MIYEGLIPSIHARESIRDGLLESPEELGRAVAEASGDQMAGQLAAARAMLAEAVQRKGF
jgi:hypothetical protein